MHKQSKLTSVAIPIFLLIAIIFTGLAAKSLYDGTRDFSAVTLNQATLTIAGTSYEVELPYKINVLPDRTPVTVTISVPDAPLKNSIYIKTDLSPFTVSVGDEVLYSYGHDGERPSFMDDPSNHSVMITDVNLIENTSITITYLSPVSQNDIIISPIYLGSQGDVFQHLMNQMGPILVCCVVLLSLGLLLVVGALILTSLGVNGISLVWVGLYYTASGLWILGECDLSNLLFFTPTILYLIARLGMFLTPLSMLLIATSLVQMRHARVFNGIAIGFGVFTLSAILCQILDWVQLEQCTKLYNWGLLLSMTYLLINLVIEWRCRNQKGARRLLIPVMLMVGFGVVQVLDLAWKPVHNYVHLVQVSATTIATAILMVALIRTFIRHAVVVQGRQAFQLELLSYQVEEQNRHQKQVAENAQKIRAQSHDLRHQLAVIRQLNQGGNPTALEEYLDNLVENIPQERAPYCENIAVNAVLSHYANHAQQEGIGVDIALTVLATCPLVRDDELTAIFGNLLENAVEACQRVIGEAPSITLRGEYRYGVLTVVMTNSYDGFWEESEGRARSHKRDAFGVGLSSIKQIAQSHNGQTRFCGMGNGVFHSSVYLTVGEVATPSHAKMGARPSVAHTT